MYTRIVQKLHTLLHYIMELGNKFETTLFIIWSRKENNTCSKTIKVEVIAFNCRCGHLCFRCLARTEQCVMNLDDIIYIQQHVMRE
jgi:hypothetical protein